MLQFCSSQYQIREEIYSKMHKHIKNQEKFINKTLIMSVTGRKCGVHTTDSKERGSILFLEVPGVF
jgi:hypothetical protein